MVSALGEEAPAFFESLQGEVPVSIRLNRRKPTLQWADAAPVPWFAGGRYLPARPVFTLDPYLHAGAYYVQEASSMFIAYAYNKLVKPEEKICILDLCGAPGGKSTLLADLMNEQSLLVANEVIHSRFAILRENLLKWGWPSIWLTRLDPSGFAPLSGFFDLVVVDAPCSGEGLFRRDPNAAGEWSVKQTAFCAARQLRILEDALPLVKPGGLLFYSTCTYNHLENIDQVTHIRNRGFHCVDLDPPADWQVDRRGNATSWGYQFYPHKVKGEGFFFSALKKDGRIEDYSKPIFKEKKTSNPSKKQQEIIRSWISRPTDFEFRVGSKGEIQMVPAGILPEVAFLNSRLNSGMPGIPIGIFKGDQFIPHTALAMANRVSDEVPRIDLSLEEAIQYLKKGTPAVHSEQTGWHQVRYGGYGLGWAKVLKNRINNYYPSEWRIRMQG